MDIASVGLQIYTTNIKSARLEVCAIRKTLTSVRNSYFVILHHSTKPTSTQVTSISDKAVQTQGALSSGNLGIYRRTNSSVLHYNAEHTNIFAHRQHHSLHFPSFMTNA